MRLIAVFPLLFTLTAPPAFSGELSDREFVELVGAELGIYISTPLNCNYLHQDKAELPLRCAISDHIAGQLITIDRSDRVEDIANLYLRYKTETEAWNSTWHNTTAPGDAEFWGIKPQYTFAAETNQAKYVCASGDIEYPFSASGDQPLFLQKAICNVIYKHTYDEDTALTITFFDRGLCSEPFCNLRRKSPAWNIHASINFVLGLIIVD
ncbi:MAG TPA: hypothetical protein ENK28_03495 [Aliiroseovarius sp.]|nr:hypothetical protein [Aliiroseovarius sp.]